MRLLGVSSQRAAMSRVSVFTYVKKERFLEWFKYVPGRRFSLRNEKAVSGTEGCLLTFTIGNSHLTSSDSAILGEWVYQPNFSRRAFPNPTARGP